MKVNMKVNVKDYKSVYLMEIDNGLTKIGVSNNPERRKKEIEDIYDVKVKRIFGTSKNNCAFEIEGKLHDLFSDNWEKGEFFYVPYDVAKKKLIDLYYLYTQLAKFKDIPITDRLTLTTRSSICDGLFVDRQCELKRGSYKKRRSY